MKQLAFITSREQKFREMQAMLPGIELVRIEADLPEIQEINAVKIVRNKLEAGFAHVPKGNFIVDDTSVYFDCLGGKLPGPLMKWFFKGMGLQKIYEMTRDMRNNRATAVTLIGYANPTKQLYVFEGKMRGLIVPPRGKDDFDWNAIFQPEGHQKTFGEMTQEEKNHISMRRFAAEEFIKFLKPQK